MEQTNQAVEQKKTGGTRLKKRKKTPLAAVGITAAIIVAAYLALCAYVGSLDTFYPHYHINGIDMSGLTVAQAQEKLETELLDREITLIHAETQEELSSITVSDLGYNAESFRGDAQNWMDDLKSDGFLKRGWRFLSFLTGRYSGDWRWPEGNDKVFDATASRLIQQLTQDPVHTAYDLKNDGIAITRAKDGRSISVEDLNCLRDLSSYQDTYQVAISFDLIPATTMTAREIYDEVSGEMKNAGYDINTDSIIPEKVGAEFDVTAAQSALDAAQPGETVTIPATIEMPSVTAEQLESVLFRDVLGEARTHVSGTAARISNVKLAASAFNNVVLNSGDVFSYNEIVGQRTVEKGYKPAPAYVRGETVDEIGGGVCQPSSTLYLACLRANLEITERYAHRYVPAYIAKGMDATVSWNGPDYKFTNNTDYPIRIITEYDKGYLTVKLLGTNVTGITAKMTFEQLSTTPWTTVYEEDETLAPGAEKVKTTPYTGYKVKTYRHLYDASGKWISSTYEATSDYKVRNKVILRGPVAGEPEIPVIGTGDITIPVETPDTSVEPEIPVIAPEVPETPDITPQPPSTEVEMPDAVPESSIVVVPELEVAPVTPATTPESIG